MILAAADATQLAGIVLTGDLRPSAPVLKVIRELQFPVLLAKDDSYAVASKVHDLTVKTRQRVQTMRIWNFHNLQI
jgi:BioD-like phosphotransacetylase family protein